MLSSPKPTPGTNLRANVVEATALHFEDATTHPSLIQLHYVKDELIPVEAA
jgi:hypothetical protein